MAMSPSAGSEILISKSQPGADGKPTSLIQRVSVKGLIDAADPDANLKLSGGEEVRVPLQHAVEHGKELAGFLAGAHLDENALEFDAGMEAAHQVGRVHAAATS